MADTNGTSADTTCQKPQHCVMCQCECHEDGACTQASGPVALFVVSIKAAVE